MPWPFIRRKSEATPERQNAAAAFPTTGFAFDLFRELAAQSVSENVFLSPASVRLCLLLLHDGARGETRRCIAEALGFSGVGKEEAQLANVSLKSTLQRPSKGVQLSMANSLWYQQGIGVDPTYIAHAREMYDADVNQLDFGRTDAASRINAWVSQKTAGKITRMASGFDPLTLLVALNAIYFKGSWARPFRRELTRDAPFVTGIGQKKILPAMLQAGTFLYYEHSEFQAVCLPYLNYNFVMYIFLPARKSQLRTFHNVLNSAAWEKWMKKFENVPGTLRLPRTKIDYAAGLRTVLTNLGMSLAFDRERAEFTGIKSDLPAIWIDDILHRAVVEVNEEGTEAAAATMGMMFAASPKPQRPQRHFEMIVDRPFSFFIGERQTGNILFTGSVVDPG